MTQSVFSINDESLETGSHTINSVALTAANFDAQNTLIDSYSTALMGISLGNLWKDSRNTVIATDKVKPGTLIAQRENKILIRYQADTTKSYHNLEVPCPDFANLTQEGNTDFVVLADAGVMAAYVVAFEACVTNPLDITEAVTVVSAQLVGRNI